MLLAKMQYSLSASITAKQLQMATGWALSLLIAGSISTTMDSYLTFRKLHCSKVFSYRIYNMSK